MENTERFEIRLRALALHRVSRKKKLCNYFSLNDVFSYGDFFLPFISLFLSVEKSDAKAVVKCFALLILLEFN